MMVLPCTERRTCRAGGRGDLLTMMELGEMELSGFPLPDDPPGERYPLTLAYALESGLVQLRHTVDPELLYRQYWYHSGTNEAMREHLRVVVAKAPKLRPGDWAVDIGSNDGTLLSMYPPGVETLGFEPAQNISAVRTGHVVRDFFNLDDARRVMRGARAKVVTTLAMMYDLDDPVLFAQQVRDLLAEDGVWIIEMHYLPLMLERNEVDAICHEHLCYYDLSALQFVLRQAGMTVSDVELNDVNGGSMLVAARRSERAGAPSVEATNLMAQERGTSVVVKLMDFAARAQDNRKKLIDLLRHLRLTGKRVWGYGASTKGNTLLQYCGITTDLVEKIAERNPDKWGRVTSGSRIPIVSEEEMREAQPDYLLVLPYHFIEAFKTREAAYLRRGGKFIVPVPEPRIVGDA